MGWYGNIRMAGILDCKLEVYIATAFLSFLFSRMIIWSDAYFSLYIVYPPRRNGRAWMVDGG